MSKASTYKQQAPYIKRVSNTNFIQICKLRSLQVYLCILICCINIIGKPHTGTFLPTIPIGDQTNQFYWINIRCSRNIIGNHIMRGTCLPLTIEVSKIISFIKQTWFVSINLNKFLCYHIDIVLSVTAYKQTYYCLSQAPKWWYLIASIDDSCVGEHHMSAIC
jgi:hypothetical protein